MPSLGIAPAPRRITTAYAHPAAGAGTGFRRLSGRFRFHLLETGIQAIRLSPYRADLPARRPVRLGTAAGFLACYCPLHLSDPGKPSDPGTSSSPCRLRGRYSSAPRGAPITAGVRAFFLASLVAERNAGTGRDAPGSRTLLYPGDPGPRRPLPATFRGVRPSVGTRACWMIPRWRPSPGRIARGPQAPGRQAGDSGARSSSPGGIRASLPGLPLAPAP